MSGIIAIEASYPTEIIIDLSVQNIGKCMSNKKTYLVVFLKHLLLS